MRLERVSVLDLAGGLFAVGLAAATFVVDLALPTGIAAGVPYVVVVMLTIWAPSKRYVIMAAAICSGLTVVGALGSPASGIEPRFIWINRGLALFVIWATAILVTAYQDAQRSLGRSEHRLGVLLQSASEGVLLVDVDGRVLSVNARAEEMFGWSAADLTGKPVEVLVPPSVRDVHVGYRRDFVTAPHARPMGQGIALQAVRKDRTQFPVEISLSYVGSGRDLLVMAFVTDISARREAERQLREYAERVEASNRELEEFAYIASHDLQEPLRKIQAFSERIERRLGNELDATAGDYFERMRKAADRGRILIDGLLSYSRITSKAKPFEPVPLDSVVRDVLEDLELSVEQAEAEVTVDALPTIDGDSLQLRQLFQNLISNALKFRSPDRGCRIQLLAEEAARDGREGITIKVQDNGIGFEPEYAAKIFRIFQRLHAGSRYPGTGIGLAVCQKIVERHQGSIAAESSPGHGTTFSVWLPSEGERNVQPREPQNT